MEILNRIIPNAETELPLSARFISELNIYEKEKGKWYIKSLDIDGREKLVFNEETGKKAPEEIVRQLFIYELIHEYHFPPDRIKIEQQVKFGREKKRADLIVYQNDKDTPLILIEIKAPNEKIDVQQLKSYLNAEGSPIGVGFNGKSISRFIRPYPKEFDTIRDLPYEDEYQIAKDADNLIGKIKELINDRKWTLLEITEINKKRQYNLREKIETLEELVLANSGVDSFDEIFKLIYTKLYDEFEAENRENQTLFFRDYSSAKITHERISKLFDEAKEEWKDVFEETDRIKLTPEHLEIMIGELAEIKLYGANLRIIDEAFEYLVPDVSKGKKGQYFTPRVVIDACVNMINPGRKEYVLDPACGSAGFLLHTMEYVWEKYGMDTESSRKRYAGKYLWGIDFEERTTKISRALMLIAGDGKTHIFKENTLDFTKWSPSFKAELDRENLIADNTNRNLKYDVILSNPPFAGDIREKAIINHYNDLLGLRYSFKMEYGNIASILSSCSKEFNITFDDDSEELLKKKMQEINGSDDIDLESEEDVNSAIQELLAIILEKIGDRRVDGRLLEGRIRAAIKYKKNDAKWDKVDRHILFIERIIDMLKPGGRSIIVLPQGIFNNSNEKYVRRYITEKARILGVVGLHGNSFKPHTGTKTSLLILRKYTEEELTNGISSNDYPIFFATSKVTFKDNSGNYRFAHDSDGNPILDKNHNPLYETDLFYIAEAFVDWGRKQNANGDTMFEFLK
jgi:type I restriction enzyme M protein